MDTSEPAHTYAPIPDALAFIAGRGGLVDRAELPPGLALGVELCVTESPPLVVERDIGPRPAGPVPPLGRTYLSSLKPSDRFEFFADGTDRYEVARLIGPSMGRLAVETPAGRLRFTSPPVFTSDASLDSRCRATVEPRGQFDGGGTFLPGDLTVWGYTGPLPEFRAATLIELTDAGRARLRRDSAERHLAALMPEPLPVAALVPEPAQSPTLPEKGTRFPDPRDVPAPFRDGGDMHGDPLTARYLAGDPDWMLSQSDVSKAFINGKLTTYIVVGERARAHLYSELRAYRAAKTDRMK